MNLLSLVSDWTHWAGNQTFNPATCPGSCNSFVCWLILYPLSHMLFFLQTLWRSFIFYQIFLSDNYSDQQLQAYLISIATPGCGVRNSFFLIKASTKLKASTKVLGSSSFGLAWVICPELVIVVWRMECRGQVFVISHLKLLLQIGQGVRIDINSYESHELKMKRMEVSPKEKSELGR